MEPVRDPALGQRRARELLQRRRREDQVRVARGVVDHDHDHVVVRHARPRHNERLADDNRTETVRDGLLCLAVCSRQEVPDVARPF